MDDCLKEALDIVKAQAKFRSMTAGEITSMVASLTANLKGIVEPGGCVYESGSAKGQDPKKAIKEKSVTCLECGESFKVITKRHLITHGLDKKSYLEKHGLKPGTALASKELTRTRRTKMKDMKLWERRTKKTVKG
ncbi:MAG: MucR family transcriptional regulator [Desulfovibrio sp.]|nr:MucR family transcriptional regulator [Desulfovibrio sp.]MBI4961251.1 MucR family transcriptional regulator [Desulfovibrio sp.]